MSNLSMPSHITLDSSAAPSSASSVVNLEIGDEAILIQEPPEEEVGDGEDGTAIGVVEAPTEGDSLLLREKLRRSLSTKVGNEYAAAVRTPRRGNSLDMNEISHLGDIDTPRQYFILTNAGKPVFTSVKDTDSDEVTNAMGLMHALISVFAEDEDKIRCINAPPRRLTFLLRAPLYFICVSSDREPESVTRSHLEYLYLQILSVISGSQLQRLFERRTGYDLRRLLEGTETFLHTLISRLPHDLGVLTGSLHALRMDSTARSRAAEALVPASKLKNILYAILIASDKVVSLVRPRKHSIHPSDLHILLSTLASPSLSSTPASWLPICLPKYNSSGFLHTFASFLRPEAGITLALVSANGEFETVKGWSDDIIAKLEDGTLDALVSATAAHDYSVNELSIPGLRHFLYKSRTHTQITFPSYEDPYQEPSERHRLINLYQLVHDAIHAKSGQETALKLQYIRTEKESVMGWITQMFELYICLSPRLPKSAAINAANSVSRWVQKEEAKLFLRDAPVF